MWQILISPTVLIILDIRMIESLCLVLGLVITTHCTMEGFIVGGKLASIKHHPHCAFLLTTCKEGEAFMCGGSILNQKIVITAAHCLLVCQEDLEPKVTISVGSSVRNEHLTKAQDFIVHVDFNEIDEGENDIALVKMKRQVKLSPKISRVAIMRSPPDGKYAMIAGWGLIDENTAEQSNYLMKLQQKIWKMKDCIELFGQMPPHTFCAAHKNNTRFVSTGDSGSALVIKDYIQVGIASFKVPKIANHVVIYTNVSQFYGWILKNAEKLYCNMSVTT